MAPYGRSTVGLCQDFVIGRVYVHTERWNEVRRTSNLLKPLRIAIKSAEALGLQRVGSAQLGSARGLGLAWLDPCCTANYAASGALEAKLLKNAKIRVKIIPFGYSHQFRVLKNWTLKGKSEPTKTMNPKQKGRKVTKLTKCKI